MKIRKATIKDCEACFELSKVKELLTATGEPIPLSYFKDIVKGKTIFLVAEEGKKIIGYSTADILPGKVALGMLLSVNPEYQNKGIGKALVQKIEQECRKRKIKYLLGYAPKSNKKTLTFHKKLGFNFGEDVVEILKKLE